jgi:TRAP-type C4-dicarboxylate transport system permease large subunit
VSKLPFALAEILRGISLPRHVIFAAIIFVYLILGCFLDINAALILTLPIIYPSVIALGFDPIWFGVTMVITMEMGLITPPFGMNVFILGGVSGVPLATIFSGVIPFVFSMIVCLILITIFPQIALLIPSMMK